MDLIACPEQGAPAVRTAEVVRISIEGSSLSYTCNFHPLTSNLSWNGGLRSLCAALNRSPITVHGFEVLSSGSLQLNPWWNFRD